MLFIFVLLPCGQPEKGPLITDPPDPDQQHWLEGGSTVLLHRYRNVVYLCSVAMWAA
jgi:hypothetical protein